MRSRSGDGALCAGAAGLTSKAISASADPTVAEAPWLEGTAVAQTHPMAEALNYALGQWTELNAFCLDGAVSIDNTSASGRSNAWCRSKNVLFVGNPRSGRTASILVSEQARGSGTIPICNCINDLPNWLPDQWRLRQAARARLTIHRK